jgi:hypothetical protein
LPTHVPRRNYVHHPLDGGQFGDSFGGSSLRGNPPRGSPFNPHVKSLGWPTFDPCMFMPPWYPSIVAKLALKQTTKLPYTKLQYLNHVKDINLDAHIRVFKNAIKANGEIVEVDI